MDNYQEQDTGRRSHGKPKKKSNLLSNILIIVGVALLLVAGGMWGAAQLRYRQQDREIAKLTIYAKVNDTEQGDEVSQAPEVDWEGLKAINPDVIAWIQIPGTEINYPVYEANDNEKYLHTSATGEYAFGGVLFADYECTRPGMQDPSTLIYGHHLLNGTMFKAIADMDNQEAFDAIDTVWYVTEQQAYECEPLALYYTQDTDMTVRKFKFESLDAFHAYLGERVSKAVVARSDAAQLVPRISHALNLITCNYYDGYGRTVLICVPKAEAAGQVAGEITTSPQSATPSGEIVEEVPAEESVEEPVEEEVVEEEWVEE